MEVNENLSLTNINGEIWKDVPEYDGYQVSNFGRVKSLIRGKNHWKGGYSVVKERIRKCVLSKDYLRVTLFRNGKKKNFRVHQLVAIAFLNHKPNGHKLVIDHIDNNTLNNCVENLQIITQRENTSKDKKGYSSKYVGVYWLETANKWTSQIHFKSKQIYLGRFETEEEASEYYQNALKAIENGTEIQIKKVNFKNK